MLRTVQLAGAIGILREVSATMVAGSPVTKRLAGVDTQFMGQTQSIYIDEQRAKPMGRSFFESLDCFGVLPRMLWPRTDMGEAQSLQKLADIALVIIHAKALSDNTLQINPSPAHDAINLSVWPPFNKISQFCSLFWRKPRNTTLGLMVKQAIWSLLIETVDPVAQRLAVHATNPGSFPTVHPVKNCRKRQ